MLQQGGAISDAELWQECADLDIDIVLWPSAYGGGPPLNAYAIGRRHSTATRRSVEGSAYARTQTE